MMALSAWLWLLTLTIGFVASAVTTVTSIGTGMIIYGVLSFFFDLKTIIPLVAPAQILAASTRCWLFRRYIHWGLAGYFFVGVIPGIYGGIWLFHVMSESVLRRVLGVFLLSFAAYEFLRPKEGSLTPHRAWLPLWGLCAGMLQGSIGIAGPLLAVVFLRYGLLKEELVAVIALFFLFGNTQRTLLYWWQGYLVGESLLLAAVLGLAMFVGVYAGRVILPHVSRERFVQLVLGMLVLFGVQFLLW